ncbi:3-methyl-2-oxobutanoate hydroxymethyltransferase [Chthonomonas calidirosea]|uniref:3-methyl-2-oxobutanoate hydroxymethyltransferase n=1 Tax=Chthonomonas calidirosea TaxID=454171 RepID=UPI0006ECA115|nr:3-methyl-2-oxobutanoate hydroxymethyltransferase [Chthonomonas calidirosea]CEK17382.1 ketopantoate hydroxymethyltransferase [Chthonomonas calidirosea]
MQSKERRGRITVPELRARKAQNEKIVMVTAYDYPSALLAERAEVDVVLVGDSVGMTMLGFADVLPVTLEMMLHHVQAVRRGLHRALLLADMPFGSYQIGEEEAMRSAIRLLKEGGAQAVKLEGGALIAGLVKKLTGAGIPVMGHIGLTPQSVHLLGGHRLQGREPEAPERMVADAKALEEAGAFGVVLEMIPADLAAKITDSISIPTIGIGAGPACDGQVLVWHDLLAIPPGRPFRHVKQYANIGEQIESALRSYAEEVRRGIFPSKEQSL